MADQAPNADEYEKLFLEKYFRGVAAKKIEALEAKLQAAQSKREELAIQEKIERVQRELDASLRLAQPEEAAPRENMARAEEKLDLSDAGSVSVHKDVAVPSYLWKYLFDYQQAGAKWMIDLHIRGKGGILADEMGLGKTLQAITMVVGLLRAGRARRVAVLCPVTVVEQWAAELRRIDPALPVHCGGLPGAGGVGVMSYERLRREARVGRLDVLILDEGHKIKNQEAQITKLVKRLDCQSRFILTGTPVQNNLAELWSLFDFIVPGLLGSYTIFRDEFETNIKQRSDEEAAYQYSLMLRSIIEPYILRRTKQQVSHKLPGKSDKVVFLTLTAEQNDLYIKILESPQFRRSLERAQSLLSAIDLLRKVCNHPLLVAKNGLRASHEADPGCSLPSDELAVVRSALVAASCKTQALLEFLERWHGEGRKVLVFTQTVQMQRILVEVLNMRRYQFLKMSGSTTPAQRQALVDRFNTDPDLFIFLLSTRVGGLGLNLTGASRIILYDTDWNPAVDKQAKERVYRYGQQQDVEIYRFLCRGTVEERIYQRQIYKDCLSRKILTDPSIRMDRDVSIDLLSYSTCPDRAPETCDYDDGSPPPQDSLVAVREEDKRAFAVMKDFGFKSALSGNELIEFITRREMNLK
ncbi:DNA excision repair protein ERCC-6 [Pancytospora philotis]|nr:DNA excision repair protein ERCC-6 [Pancytospora philotis]